MAGGNHNPKQAVVRTDVERIVRQVLAEIAGGKPVAQSSATSNGAGDLVVSKRVVSLADVEGRLTGVTRVIVERGAVFTPAARDELKQHGVSIASAVRAGIKQAKLRIGLAAAETKYDAKAFIAALATDGFEVETLKENCLPGTIDKLCCRVKHDGVGLLITSSAAAALCLANRQSGVRAALAVNVAAVEGAVSAIGANLLVVDPAGKSLFELRQIVRQWLRGGRPACPAALETLLG